MKSERRYGKTYLKSKIIKNSLESKVINRMFNAFIVAGVWNVNNYTVKQDRIEGHLKCAVQLKKSLSSKIWQAHLNNKAWSFLLSLWKMWLCHNIEHPLVSVGYNLAWAMISFESKTFANETTNVRFRFMPTVKKIPQLILCDFYIKSFTHYNGLFLNVNTSNTLLIQIYSLLEY